MLIETLSQRSKVSINSLEWIAKTASSRYKMYTVKKRSGGERTIEQPSRQLKAIQKWISSEVFKQYPIHECATAYSKGCSIKLNAERHIQSNFTIRLDFKDFFHSFRFRHVAEFLHEQNEVFAQGLNAKDIGFISAIVTRHGRLTIGAPSSPNLSNVMMYSFDRQVEDYAKNRDLIYTRYADDIFLSTKIPNALSKVDDDIGKISTQHRHSGLQINRRKTTYLSRRYNRSITGLVVTPDRKISLGRERKRKIKSLVFAATLDQLDVDQLSYLAGLLSFASGIEPTFLASLENKYGQEKLDILLKRRRKPLKEYGPQR